MDGKRKINKNEKKNKNEIENEIENENENEIEGSLKLKQFRGFQSFYVWAIK